LFRVATIVCAVVAAFCLCAVCSRAQELTPRTYAALPIDSNVLGIGYAVSAGTVLTDSSLPVSDVQASLDRSFLAYAHTFAIGKQAANLQTVLPYFAASASGNIMERSAATKRWGYGDLLVRLGWNLVGNPALKPAEFGRRQPATTFGASLTIQAPTGAYNPSKLINAGNNRWAFLPEVGFEKPIGKWFVDGSGGAWLFTSNDNYLSGHVRSQHPVVEFQTLGGYQWRPGLWLSAGGVYYGGGETIVDGIPNHNVLINGRYGLDFNAPLSREFAVHLKWSNWLTATSGGQFHSFGVQLQYRWLDR